MFIEQKANNMSFAMRKLMCGVGINDAKYMIRTTKVKSDKICPFYRVWANMLQRCYDERYQAKHPTYRNCTVSGEWLRFSVFRKWMEPQDWKGKVLDKDILLPGNKHYSSETCIFISPDLNKLLTHFRSSNSGHPVGVSVNTRGYKARCTYKGKDIHLGTFDTPEQAGEAYKEFKANLILEAAQEQDDPRISAGLMAHRDIVLAL